MLGDKMDSTKQVSMTRRWVLCILIFLMEITTFWNMFKVPPLMPSLFPMGFDENTIGLMMSLSNFLGMILAFPMGFMLNRIGIKNGLIFTGVVVIVGSFIGIFAQDATMMLISRFIEGGGCGIMTVAGPAAIAACMTKKHQGLAMGIYSADFPFGSFLGMNISAALFVSTGDIHSSWIFGTVIAVVSLILIILFFQVPPAEGGAAPEEVKGKLPKAPKGMWVAIIAVAFAFLCQQFILQSYLSFFPTYLQTDLTMDPSASSLLTTIENVLMIICGPIVGLVSDRLNARKPFLVAGMLGIAVVFTFSFAGSQDIAWVFAICYGFFASFIGAMVFALIPRLCDVPGRIPLGMATITFFSALGSTLGPAMFGALGASIGWQSAAWALLSPAAILAAVAVFFFVKEKRKQVQEPESPASELPASE